MCELTPRLKEGDIVHGCEKNSEICQTRQYLNRGSSHEMQRVEARVDERLQMVLSN
jgi:hypothetical protein